MSNSTSLPPDNDDKASKRASAASKGGKARALKLTSEERASSARNAAETRWTNDANKDLPKETNTGAIQLGDISIECGNLENGIRVLSTRGVSRAFGRAKTGTNITGTNAPQLPPFLAANNLKDFISEDLLMLLKEPIKYRTKRGILGHGYDATLLPDICGVILDAQRADELHESQEELAAIAEIMLRGFAKVGIIALVDEATGYQADRAKDELQRILQAYLVEEMRPWIALFPHEFFRQIYRLRGWQYKEGCAKHPGYIGTLINDWVYKRLPPPVLPELRKRNPSINGRRRAKHHQFLTEDTGIPHLDRQLAAVIALMRASRTINQFENMLFDAFPKPEDQYNFRFDDEHESS